MPKRPIYPATQNYMKRARTLAKYRGPYGKYTAASRLRNAMRTTLRRRNKFRTMATTRLPLPNDLRRHVRTFL